MRKYLLLSFALLFLMVFQAFGQDVTISGRLTDKDGSPVPGANVYVKGTKQGTITDAEGNYTISVPKGTTLVFAAVGYNQKSVVVGNQTVVNFTLEEEEIEAVTVTSYGQVIDKTLNTGAMTSVSGKDFENLPLQSFDRAIQGRLAGVAVNAASGAPGGGLTVRVRGTGSVLASNAPLYIVDGVQVNPGGVSGQGSSNALGSINPNDIESIEVLKDAASAAIYGAQSANGVVIITTKKGKKNTDRFSFTVQEGFVQPLRLFEVLDGRQYATLKRESVVNDLFQPQLPTPSQAQIDLAIAGANSVFGDPDDPNLVNFDWKKALFRTARLRTYDLTYDGGSDKTTFYIGVSYQKQEGQIIKNQWQRATARFNLSHRPSKRFLIQSNNTIAVQGVFGSIAGGEGNFLNSPFFGAFRSAPTKNAFREDGTFAQYNDGVLAFNYNILQGVNEEVRRGSGVQAVSSLKGVYNILPSLSFTAFVGVDWLNNRDENIRPRTIPVFAPGNMFNRYDRDFALNTNYTLNFNKKIGENHNVSLLGGYEYRYRETMFTSALGSSFNPNITVLNGVASALTVLGNVVENDRAGFFGQAKYNFKEKYFIDGTFRRDGSSKFGLKNRYGNFYAASLGWRITEEAFMQGIKDQLNELKIRASYGYVGNSEIGDYQNLTTFTASQQGGMGSATLQYGGLGGLRPGVLGNDLLTWEGSAQSNLGLDFGFGRGSRIFGSLDFWRRDTQDALFSVSIASDAGQRPSSVIRNVGKIRNEGIDFEIGANILTNPEGLRWVSSFNITYQRNEVLELPENKNLLIVSGREVVKGQPLSTYILPAYAGVNPATGQNMYYDANNNIIYAPLSYQVREDLSINYRDDRIWGTALPKFFGGWNNQFSYKGITLDFLWQYQYGNVTYNSDYWANLLDGMEAGSNNVTAILDRWQKPGDITNIPRLSSSSIYNGLSLTRPSNRYIEDASYIRLKTVSLGYNVPSEALKGFKSARIFVQAVNLLTFTKANIIDPEVVSTTGNPTSLLGGINQFPQGRQYSIGASLSF